MKVELELPLRTVSEANVRDRWRTRARRAADHRGTVAKALRPRTGVLPKGESIDVELVRVSAGTLDDDNLRSALKAVRDGVADALGLKSDADPRVRWSYSQQRCERGQHAVRINVAMSDATSSEAPHQKGLTGVSCTVCGSSRIAREDGSPGACSLLGCKAPLHDVEQERRSSEATIVDGPELDSGPTGGGDYSSQCSCCGEERDEPHTWKECATRLAVEVLRLHDVAFDPEQAKKLLADIGEPVTDYPPASPDDLRAAGWAVAVHNDYRLGGKTHTFWLLTQNGRAVKGEGRTDAEALDAIRAEVAGQKRSDGHG